MAMKPSTVTTEDRVKVANMFCVRLTIGTLGMTAYLMMRSLPDGLGLTLPIVAYAILYAIVNALLFWNLMPWPMVRTQVAWLALIGLGWLILLSLAIMSQRLLVDRFDWKRDAMSTNECKGKRPHCFIAPNDRAQVDL
jgi:hypothetical protein